MTTPTATPTNDRIDRVLVILAALVFAISVGLMLDERFLFRIGGRAQPDLRAIGDVLHRERDVRRRAEGELAFMPLERDAPVFDGDSVYVGESSAAEISLGPGTSVTLEAGSLVIVHSESKKPRLSIRRGSVSAKLSGSQKLVLELGGKAQEITSSGATLHAVVGPKGQASISVVGGQATVESSGIQTVIAPDKPIQIDVRSGEVRPLLAARPVVREPSPKPLALSAPAAISPRGGQMIQRTQGSSALQLELRWKPSARAGPTELELASDSGFQQPLLRDRTTDARYRYEARKDGKYYWRIRSLSNDSRAPPSPWSGPFVFEVRTLAKAPAALRPPSELSASFDRSFASPVLVAPLGRVFLKDASDRVRFEWEAVPRAKAYELTVIERAPATPSGFERRSFRTSATNYDVEIGREGPISWKVRALHALNAPPDGRTLASVTPESEANVEAVRPALDHGRPGLVSLSLMAAPYSYTLISPSLGAKGTAASSAITTRLSGEYWPVPRFGLAGYVEDTSFDIASSKFLRWAAHLDGQSKLYWGQEHGVQIIPALGLEARQYFVVTPSSASQFWTMGPSLALSVRKQFTEHLSLEGRTQYFLPVSASGLPEGASLAPDANYRNWNIGVQGYYWPIPQLGLGAGGFYELRSISYQVPGVSGADQVYTDGSYFYFSLTHRFGR